MTEELWPWKCTHCMRINRKTAVKCAICHAHWSSGTRHNTQPRQQNLAAEDTNWEDWPSFWDDSQQLGHWNTQQSRSQSRASSRSSHSAYGPKSAKQPKKGSTGKGKGQKTSGKGKRQDGNAPLAPSPFAPLATELPPWPAQDTTTSNLLPTGTVPTPHQVVETLAQKREVVQALKNAYPDHATVPPDTKDLIEKMEKDIEKLEKENSKSTTKNLHSATTALGKAQKTLTEALDARRAHRLRWTKHIADAVKLWESQLHEYRQQQASFQEVASKARADIEFARSAIQTLSTKATTATLASMPPITPISAETEDLVGDADPEPEKVQQQLQNILQSCAAALGVEMQALNQPQQQLDMTDLNEEEGDPPDKATNKRPRALEPFGGGVASSQQILPKQ